MSEYPDRSVVSCFNVCHDALGGGWTYRLDTLNVAHGQHVTADLFLREPTRWVKELARLR
jgi:hypothetical protein